MKKFCFSASLPAYFAFIRSGRPITVSVLPEFNNGVSARLGSINLDLFEISDIDGNRKLSRNEISERAQRRTGGREPVR